MISQIIWSFMILYSVQSNDSDFVRFLASTPNTYLVDDLDLACWQLLMLEMEITHISEDIWIPMHQCNARKSARSLLFGIMIFNQIKLVLLKIRNGSVRYIFGKHHTIPWIFDTYFLNKVKLLYFSPLTMMYLYPVRKWWELSRSGDKKP